MGPLWFALAGRLLSEVAAEIWDCVPLRQRRFVDGVGAAELGMLRLLRWGTAEGCGATGLMLRREWGRQGIRD